MPLSRTVIRMNLDSGGVAEGRAAARGEMMEEGEIGGEGGGLVEVVGAAKALKGGSCEIVGRRARRGVGRSAVIEVNAAT